MRGSTVPMDLGMRILRSIPMSKYAGIFCIKLIYMFSCFLAYSELVGLCELTNFLSFSGLFYVSQHF